MKALTMIFTALACGLAGYASASAADLRAAPMVTIPPASSWAGFYIGGDAGLTLDAPFKFDTVDFSDGAKINPRGGTFGGHAGHNWESGGFVYGLEAFAAWNGNSKTALLDKAGTTTLNAKVDYFGSVSARVGLSLINDNFLIYARGGLGFAHTSATVTQTEVVAPAISLLAASTFIDTAKAFEVHYGPVVGLGLEWKMFGSSNWLLRVDYQHYMLGRTSYPFGGDFQGNTSASLNLDVITAGLSRKF